MILGVLAAAGEGAGSSERPKAQKKREANAIKERPISHLNIFSSCFLGLKCFDNSLFLSINVLCSRLKSLKTAFIKLIGDLSLKQYFLNVFLMS